MSRRKRHPEARRPSAPPAAGASGGAALDGHPASTSGSSRPFSAITVGVAELAGAANLGVCLRDRSGLFALALVVLLLGSDLAALEREHHGVEPRAGVKLRHGIAHMRAHGLA